MGINDPTVGMNALRPDFDLRKKIGDANDIILFLDLPEKDFVSYKHPEGFFVYKHYVVPTEQVMGDLGLTLLILAPRICLEPLQQSRSAPVLFNYPTLKNNV